MNEDTRQSTGNRIGVKLLAVALVIIAIAIGTLLKWSLADENVIEVKNEPFPVRTIRKHPTGGGVVFLKMQFCKNVDVDGEVRISFISPTREVFLPLAKEKSDSGCVDTEIPVAIPKDIPPDTYRVKFKAYYKLNPLKSVNDEFTSSDFEVDAL